MIPLLTIHRRVLQFMLKGYNQRKAKMANVFDVARYILHKKGPMTTMKLQKLIYYCQAWSLVWEEKPLFDEKIEAWASGPVVRDLYNHHRGAFLISDIKRGDVDNLTKEQKGTINAVLAAYSDKPAQWLADLTHMEKPWNEARKGIELGENCESEITPALIHEYYSSLLPDSEPV